MKNKRVLGKFFTIQNPFKLKIFNTWFELIPDNKKQKIIEPFSGANNIVKLMYEVGFENKWGCYDIDPPDFNNFNEFKIIKCNTLTSFPKGYSVGITNPPYLAKNSATRRKLAYPDTKYDDLYKFSLEIMLNNLEYVAVIIPESFITQNIFHNRIYAISSLTTKMFDDTNCPVCLALFIPEKEKTDCDFLIYPLIEEDYHF